MTGVLFSAIDMFRRASLEELLIREERAEINKELRQGNCFLYFRRQTLRLMISVSLSNNCNNHTILTSLSHNFNNKPATLVLKLLISLCTNSKVAEYFRISFFMYKKLYFKKNYFLIKKSHIIRSFIYLLLSSYLAFFSSYDLSSLSPQKQCIMQ